MSRVLSCAALILLLGIAAGCGNDSAPLDLSSDNNLTTDYTGGLPNVALLAATQEAIDFESLSPGEIASEVFGSNGSGPVAVFGINPSFPAETNAAVIFDSANPSGEDLDLGTPNQDFGGPGVGSSGGTGSDYENTSPQGNILIIAEDLVDANEDELVDDPDDADVAGSTVTFDFSALGTVTVFSMVIIDVEAEEGAATVMFLDAEGNEIDNATLPQVGDNGLATTPFGDGVANVAKMVVSLGGSGAIDGIVFEPQATLGSIGDFVWCDENNDGVQDDGEPGIEGATVNLKCAGADGTLDTEDDLTMTATTDADGAYLFDGVPAGVCVVSVDRGSVEGKMPGENCPTELDVDLAEGQTYLDADFCFVELPPKTGSIGDTVWCDENNDGVQDDGEAGIAGVTVSVLCAGEDGTFETDDDLTFSTTTDADGKYLFSGIPMGVCVVSVDPSTAGDKEPGENCPLRLEVDLAEGENYLDADFCFVELPPELGSIGDFVWCDLNNDGVQDDDEPGIEGVLVMLKCAGDDGVLDTEDDIRRTTTTDANGNYVFEDLPAGECWVGPDTTTAGDKVPGENCLDEAAVFLEEGEDYVDADFCFVTPAPPANKIGDLVWCDQDGDGQYDDGEPGVEGAVVLLQCAGDDEELNTEDDIRLSTETNGDGIYCFENPPLGKCLVIIDVNSVDGKVPGENCPLVWKLNVEEGVDYLDNDFCFVEEDPQPDPGVIGDTVWCDENNDGHFDDGEPGIEGAVVILHCAGADDQLGTDDDVRERTTTDERGRYLFERVPAGRCVVTVDADTVGDKEPSENCPRKVTVDLAPGEEFLDADFCFVNKRDDQEGCSHGFWKTHLDAWADTGYDPHQTVASVFGEAEGYEGIGDATLLEALRFHGGNGVSGAARNLLKQAVASLLNAVVLDFPWSESEVIDAVNELLASEDRHKILRLADELDHANNLGCPLGGDEDECDDKDGDGECDEDECDDKDGDGECDEDECDDKDGDGECDEDECDDKDGDGECDDE